MKMTSEIDLLQTSLARLRSDLLGIKLALKFRKWARKDGFDPDQARDDAGRWTDGGGTEELAMGRGNAAECDMQYSKDTLICNLVKTPLCWAQAMERYAACLAGRQIPQLRF